MTTTIPENTLAELKFLFGVVVNTLNKDELMILSTCQIEGEVNNQRLRYLVDQHKTEITKLLKDLCKAGFLLPENKGRWTTYQLNKEGSIKEDSIKEGSSKAGSLNEDSSKEGSSNRDSSNRDSSNRDSSNRDSSEIKHKLSYSELIEIIMLSCKDYQSIDEISKNLASLRHVSQGMSKLDKMGFPIRF